MPTSNSQLSLAERTLMKERILLFHSNGKTVREIAECVPCSVRHVYKSLPAILEDEAHRLAEVSKRAVISQYSRLDRLYSEAAAQWVKSCGQRVETTAKTEGEFPNAQAASTNRPGKLKSVSGSTTIEGLGDPRYIEQMRSIMADQRRLLQLDKEDVLKAALQNISLTQVNVNAQNALMPVVLPGATDIAALMAQFGMNPDGTACTPAQLTVDVDTDTLQRGDALPAEHNLPAPNALSVCSEVTAAEEAS